ncbi:hypothetical protein ACLOJK_021936 [Asimina triloba]
MRPIKPVKPRKPLAINIRHKYNHQHSQIAAPPDLSPELDLGPSPAPEALSRPSPAPEPANASSDSNTNNSSKVFNVKAFGAVGDAVTDDTQAFRAAWEEACQVESGTVLAPQGYTFMIQTMIFVGPCENGFTFQVDGVLSPPDGPDNWPRNASRRQWLVFYRMDGMRLQGRGIIDGRGEKWWNLPCKPHRGINGTTMTGPCDSPVALRFFMSSNLTVQGLKIRNSPQFHFRFDGCRNVHIDRISVYSPALSPNTDGIHVENTDSVGIYNSIISNGGSEPFFFFTISVITIATIAFPLALVLSTIGSLGIRNSHACVKNITVSNSIIRHSANGVRLKTWQGGSGSVSSVTFQDIVMDTVRNPIIVDQYYCLAKGCANQTSAVLVSDITYSSIKGTYDVRSPPMHFACSDSVPCTNLTLADVELLPAQGHIVLDPFCWNAYGKLQTLTIPPVACLLEGQPRSLTSDDIQKC